MGACVLLAGLFGGSVIVISSLLGLGLVWGLLYV